MTWGFWGSYCYKAHAILSSDYLSKKGGQTAASNLQQLQEDLADLK